MIGLSLAGFFSEQLVLAAGILPQGGHYVAGSGSIGQNGANLSITQPAGSRGIIEWTDFSIGSGHIVSIDNGAGATLNRVTGNDASAIRGSLTGTGSVYLVNPHGVLIGRTGVVSTGGTFLASTLDIPNDTFLYPARYPASSYTGTYTGNSTANVVNLGKIDSSGGDVFLLAANTVKNEGAINAPNGNAEFAVGHKVDLLEGHSTYQQEVFLTIGSGGTVVNRGTVEAALINLQAADGNIFALAGHSGALRAIGTATRDGHVWLVADTATATSITNTGNIDARGAQISARSVTSVGGTVDMSGANVKVGGADVLTKTWNITTGDFIVETRTARTLSASLGRGAVITVLANGGDGQYGADGKGNIAIESSVRWQGANSLTLQAAHSLSVAPGAVIANQGTGSLLLYADWYGRDNAGSVANQGVIDWSRSTGLVTAMYDINGSLTRGDVRGNPCWSAPAFSGLVTQFTAYELINSFDDLRAINNNLAGTYGLGNRALDYTDTADFAGIGSAAAPFTGQFDGLGHVGPQDLHMAGASDTGLFNVIGKNAVVRNLSVDDSAATSSAGAVGLLAGTNYGYLVNITAFGGNTVTGNPGAVAGGLVGENFGRIERAEVSVNVNGAGIIGGLVGRNDGVIDQSSTDSYVSTGTQGTVGGLVGANNGMIVQSYANATLNGGTVVGGLVGANAGIIRESYAASTLTPGAGATIGGIAGTNSGRIGTDVFWNSESSGAAAGVGSGTPVAASSGLTNAQLSVPASFGPTWDFSATGTWVADYFGHNGPVLRWQTDF